jgi:hypothetical protein
MKVSYRSISITATICTFAPIFLYSQQINPPFDTRETINEATLNRSYDEAQDLGFLIDTNIAYIPAADDQYCSAVAFDGTNYLVVWQDSRYNWEYDIWGTDIWAARVTTSGIIIDTAGIAIATSVFFQTYPAVSFDGTNYFIVWQDSRWTDIDIYGARVSTAGIVLDTSGIAISTAVDNQWLPRVAFDGINYFVTWADQRNGSFDIYGARVNPNGFVLDPDGIAISTAQGWQRNPSVIFGGTCYLVAWEDERSGGMLDIYGSRVTQAGIVLDTTGICISSAYYGQMFPSVAHDGTNFFVVWEDWRNDDPDIYGTRIDQAGIVLDTAGITISNAYERQGLPFIAFDGGNFLVTWIDERNGSFSDDIYGSRVTPQGIVIDTSGLLISNADDRQIKPAVAFDSINGLISWHDFRSGKADIYGTRINTSTGVILDTNGILVSSQAYSQYDPAVASDGTDYLLTFTDTRNGWCDIFGARIDHLGVIIDPAGFPISTAAWDQLNPAVSFDGAEYLAIWQDCRNGDFDIYGTRISQAGVVLDTSGFVISTAAGGQKYPALAFDGTNYLAVWEDYRNGVSDIYGARITTDGSVIDTLGLAISLATDYQWFPAIAFDGTNYFVVWEDQRLGSYSDTYGARVDQSGVVLDPNGIAISTAQYRQSWPSIAFDGMNYLIVWQDSRGVQAWDIYGARVTTSGAVLDTNGIAISTAMNWQYFPEVSFNGTDYTIIWQDDRNSTLSDIYGAVVGTSGMVLDTFPVAISTGRQQSPTLARGSGNQLLATFCSWTDSINNHPANTIRIWGILGAIGIEQEAELAIHTGNWTFKIYPNPALRECHIKYALPQKTNLSITVYDITGRLVKNVLNESRDAGAHDTLCDMDVLPQGVYFIRIETDVFTRTQKIILID